MSGVAIIGCGLIGKKRAAALGGDTLVVACDAHKLAAESLARTVPGASATTDIHAAVSHPDVKWVIVATPHDSLTGATEQAIRAGKHVLVEKPAGISSAQLGRLERLSTDAGVLVRVGFNHRYHRALVKARELVDAGALGPLMFMRGRYGHGARVGYEKEWRADPARSGGGELMDQGMHLIDLSSWFLGEWDQIDGHAATYYWDMKVDDNAFLNLRTASGQTAWLQVSCTEWKNMFCLEIYGRQGKLQIDGLGGSYGVERLSHYHMLPEMGPPETTIYEYPQADSSWSLEVQAFQRDMQLGRVPRPGLAEARGCLEVVEAIYRKSGYR